MKPYSILFVIGLLIGVLIGYLVGTYVTLKAVFEVSRHFISIDYDMVEKAVFMYKNNIGQCFP